MNKYILLLFFFSSTTQASLFARGDADNGKKLFAKYECDSCHKGKVGGDGSAIFTRTNRIVHVADELVPRIKFCSGVVGANLTAQEEQDLAAHLNQNYYHFE